MSLKAMLTPDEAALELNVTTRTILRYLASGQLAGQRRGVRGGWRISPAAPDGKGVTSEEPGGCQRATTLQARITDRTAWRTSAGMATKILEAAQWKRIDMWINGRHRPPATRVERPYRAAQ